MNVTGFGKVPPTGVIVIVNIADWPATAVWGRVGLDMAKSKMVKVSAADVPPPGAGFRIDIKAEPPVAMSEAGTVTVNSVLFTNVVVSPVPFQWTTEPPTKLVPVSVRIKADPWAIADVGDSDPSDGPELMMLNVNGPVAPPPGVGLNTVT